MASLSQGRTAAAQCGLFTYKSVPVIFEPPWIIINVYRPSCKEFIIITRFIQNIFFLEILKIIEIPNFM